MGEEVTTVDGVVAGLERIERALPPTDGLKWFTLIYCDATRAVAGSLARGEFDSPQFMQRLVIRFGNAFFGAMGGTLLVSNAWSPVFNLRYDPGIAPLQFAVAGYSSQMGYEMPLGLVSAWRDLGLTPDADTPEHRDYERLSMTVAETHISMGEYLRTTAVAETGGRFEGVDEVVARWDHRDARTAAWEEGVALRRLWDDHERFTARLAQLDSAVGRTTKQLLRPTAA